jgi:uncharacterized Zn finger protein
MSEQEWKVCDDTCPKCGKHTEILQDETYHYAERCPHCRWVIRFDD